MDAAIDKIVYQVLSIIPMPWPVVICLSVFGLKMLFKMYKNKNEILHFLNDWFVIIVILLAACYYIAVYFSENIPSDLPPSGTAPITAAPYHTSGVTRTPTSATTPPATMPPATTPKPDIYYFSLLQNKFNKGTDDLVQVYTGPGDNYFHSNNGHASSYSREFRCCGLTNGNWLMIRYTVKDGIRYGYIDISKYMSNATNIKQLSFNSFPGEVAHVTDLWEDPFLNSAVNHLPSIGRLSVGDSITFLGYYVEDGNKVAYIEAFIDGQKARGFVDKNHIKVY